MTVAKPTESETHSTAASIQGRKLAAAVESRKRWEQYLTALTTVAGVTVAGFFFTPLIGSHATALVYLLALALVSPFVGRGPALAAAALGALAWDFFFLPPALTFRIHSFEDLMLFALYFVVALTSSQQIATAMDRLRLNQLSEKARLLEESERLSKTLLDSMSHELRTPIAVIQSATDNLTRLGDGNLSQLQRQMVAEIGEAAGRLDRLVENTLEISRLEAGAVKPVLNDCDPADLVHLCVAETEKRLARHRVSVRIEPNLPMAPMDFVLTRYALTNLLSNAAAHTPEGTEVRVEAACEADTLKLSVADNGPGIDPGLLSRIFDKFSRAPGAAAGGVGLGLYLVKGFVEAQQGTITADNRPEGGAEFVIRLPLGRRRQEDTSARSAA